MKRYVRHLKIGRTFMISGRLFTSMSQNVDVLSTFCGRKYYAVWTLSKTLDHAVHSEHGSSIRDRPWHA